MRFAKRVGSVALALAGALALGAACTPADVTGPAEQACKDYAFAFCQQFQSCSTTYIALHYGTVPTCELLAKTACLYALEAPSSGDSPAQREACTQAITMGAWDCTDLLSVQNPPEACQSTPGTLDNGAPCALRQQCHSNYCAYPLGQLCGTCTDPPALGAPCPSGQCVPGQVCPPSMQVCTARGAVGASCGTGLACNEGLNCSTASGSGMCEPGVTMLDAPCSYTGGGCTITAGLACNAATGTCQTAKLSPPGGPCGVVDDQNATCAIGSCVRGACVANPPLGAPCEVGIGAVNCASPGTCAATGSGTAGTCQLRGAIACQ